MLPYIFLVIRHQDPYSYDEVISSSTEVRHFEDTSEILQFVKQQGEVYENYFKKTSDSRMRIQLLSADLREGYPIFFGEKPLKERVEINVKALEVKKARKEKKKPPSWNNVITDAYETPMLDALSPSNWVFPTAAPVPADLVYYADVDGDEIPYTLSDLPNGQNPYPVWIVPGHEAPMSPPTFNSMCAAGEVPDQGGIRKYSSFVGV